MNIWTEVVGYGCVPPITTQVLPIFVRVYAGGITQPTLAMQTEIQVITEQKQSILV